MNQRHRRSRLTDSQGRDGLYWRKTSWHFTQLASSRWPAASMAKALLSWVFWASSLGGKAHFAGIRSPLVSILAGVVSFEFGRHLRGPSGTGDKPGQIGGQSVPCVRDDKTLRSSIRLRNSTSATSSAGGRSCRRYRRAALDL